MSLSSERTKNIPVIESEVFETYQSAHFAVGMVAVNGITINGFNREFEGAAKLRTNTYLDMGFVDADDLDENGTELNHDDNRSTHFVILERLAQAGFARVVGNMRLIVKKNEEPLPMEKFYPEVFTDALPPGSVEVSRLISRHENVKIQSLLKWPLFIAGFKNVDEKKLCPVYGLLKSELVRSLVLQGVPVDPLAQEKYIHEINATKEPVEIDVARLKRVISLTGDQGINVSQGGFSYLNLDPRKEELI